MTRKTFALVLTGAFLCIIPARADLTFSNIYVNGPGVTGCGGAVGTPCVEIEAHGRPPVRVRSVYRFIPLWLGGSQIAYPRTTLAEQFTVHDAENRRAGADAERKREESERTGALR